MTSPCVIHKFVLVCELFGIETPRYVYLSAKIDHVCVRIVEWKKNSITGVHFLNSHWLRKIFLIMKTTHQTHTRTYSKRYKVSNKKIYLEIPKTDMNLNLESVKTTRLKFHI